MLKKLTCHWRPEATLCVSNGVAKQDRISRFINESKEEDMARQSRKVLWELWR